MLVMGCRKNNSHLCRPPDRKYAYSIQ